jgi:hypothetical protein
VNLRTFLPPEKRPAPPPPEPGEPARELPIEDAAAPVQPPGEPFVVSFLRHTGCPFAEATMRALRETDPDGVRLVAVSHAPAQATEAWCSAVGGADGVRVAIDADRSGYTAWGLGRSSLGHFMGLRSLREVARLARRGIRNRHPEGTRWQAAGTFAIDRDGIVRWRHLPAHAGDIPDFDEAVRAARGD